MTTYASFHLDGSLTCRSLQAGILALPALPTPVVQFQVLAGLQSHPVWAFDRLAVVVYAYCQAAASLQAEVQVNVAGTLVSGQLLSLILAKSIEWHTSRQVRVLGERTIAELTADGPLPAVWPQNRLSLPISLPELPGRRAQAYRPDTG